MRALMERIVATARHLASLFNIQHINHGPLVDKLLYDQSTQNITDCASCNVSALKIPSCAVRSGDFDGQMCLGLWDETHRPPLSVSLQ